jgi:predicted nucleic-acid-binding Zn-ribbon protein
MQCIKCTGDMRTAELRTQQGSVMVSGPASVGPQPLLAYVCHDCGYVELYTTRLAEGRQEREREVERLTPAPMPEMTPVPAV